MLGSTDEPADPRVPCLANLAITSGVNLASAVLVKPLSIEVDAANYRWPFDSY
jgi:hypothetical protein